MRSKMVMVTVAASVVVGLGVVGSAFALGAGDEAGDSPDLVNQQTFMDGCVRQVWEINGEELETVASAPLEARDVRMSRTGHSSSASVGGGNDDGGSVCKRPLKHMKFGPEDAPPPPWRDSKG